MFLIKNMGVSNVSIVDPYKSQNYLKWTVLPNTSLS
jgi:hypothetical protein